MDMKMSITNAKVHTVWNAWILKIHLVKFGSNLVICISFKLDINECNTTSTNPCEQICENTEGGYNCHCFAGYRKTAGLCEGI